MIIPYKLESCIVDLLDGDWEKAISVYKIPSEEVRLLFYLVYGGKLIDEKNDMIKSVPIPWKIDGYKLTTSHICPKLNTSPQFQWLMVDFSEKDSFAAHNGLDFLNTMTGNHTINTIKGTAKYNANHDYDNTNSWGRCRMYISAEKQKRLFKILSKIPHIAYHISDPIQSLIDLDLETVDDLSIVEHYMNYGDTKTQLFLRMKFALS